MSRWGSTDDSSLTATPLTRMPPLASLVNAPCGVRSSPQGSSGSMRAARNLCTTTTRFPWMMNAPLSSATGKSATCTFVPVLVDAQSGADNVSCRSSASRGVKRRRCSDVASRRVGSQLPCSFVQPGISFAKEALYRCAICMTPADTYDEQCRKCNALVFEKGRCSIPGVYTAR